MILYLKTLRLRYAVWKHVRAVRRALITGLQARLDFERGMAQIELKK